MAGGIFEVQVNTLAKVHFSLVDGGGNLVSGQAANVVKTLDDEAGAASEAVAIAELGATGRYVASFTPTKSAIGGHRYFLRLRGPTPATDGSVLEYYVASWPTSAFSGLAGPLLTSLANLKDYLGGEASGANDTLLTRLIGVASDAIERYCNRAFTLTAYTAELYDGSGTDTLVLRQAPIVGVPVLREFGVSVSVGLDPVGGFNVIVYQKSGMLRRPFAIFFPFDRYYSVDYSAGYSTIPAPVEQAALDLAALMYKERDRIGLQQRGMGPHNVALVRKLPDTTLLGMKGYRRIAMGIAA